MNFIFLKLISDIDECMLWGRSGHDLCMGRCINTPGSFTCDCPDGYKLDEDGRTCKGTMK